MTWLKSFVEKLQTILTFQLELTQIIGYQKLLTVNFCYDKLTQWVFTKHVNLSLNLRICSLKVKNLKHDQGIQWFHQWRIYCMKCQYLWCFKAEWIFRSSSLKLTKCSIKDCTSIAIFQSLGLWFGFDWNWDIQFG